MIKDSEAHDVFDMTEHAMVMMAIMLRWSPSPTKQ